MNVGVNITTKGFPYKGICIFELDNTNDWQASQDQTIEGKQSKQISNTPITKYKYSYTNLPWRPSELLDGYLDSIQNLKVRYQLWTDW